MIFWKQKNKKQEQKHVFVILYYLLPEDNSEHIYKTSSNHINKQRTLLKSVHDVVMISNECLFHKHNNSAKVNRVGSNAGKPVEESFRKKSSKMKRWRIIDESIFFLKIYFVLFCFMY